jgi:hypothetical protein
MLALTDGRRIVFETMSGKARWALPVRTDWIEWTR